MYKKIFFVFMLLCFISFASAVTLNISTFYNQSNPFNINWTSSGNYTFYIEAPLLSYISSLNMSISESPPTHGTCYQEDFNSTTPCGGTVINELYQYGNWVQSPYGRLVDGDYNTEADTFASGTVIVNYTKPLNMTGAIWQIKDSGALVNVTVPRECIELYDDKLSFAMVAGYPASTEVSWYCINGSADDTLLENRYLLRHYNGGGDAMYEEAIFFNMTTGINQLKIYYENSAYEYYSQESSTNQTLPVNDSLDISSYLNDVLTGGCDSPAIQDGSNCRIPVTFYSSNNGTLTVELTNASYSYGIVNCSSYTNYTLNFTSYEETNLTSLNVDIVGTIEYSINYTINSTNYNNYSFSYTNVSEFQLCIYPEYVTIYANLYLRYDSVNGYNMRYYIENITLTNTTQQVNLYNHNTQTGISELTTYLKNNIYDAYQNVIMKLQRYYPAENLWRTVQVDKSDEAGKGIFYVIQNDEDYKFIFEVDNVEVDRTESFKFVCSSTTECEETFIIYPLASSDAFSGMTGGITYNNDTGIFSLSWSDPQGSSSTVRFLVEQYTTVGHTTICDSTSSSSSGSVNCNVSDYQGIITARAFRAASPNSTWVQKTIERINTALWQTLGDEGYASDGVLLSTFILMGAIGFGAATGSPALVVLFGIAGLIFINMLGLSSGIMIEIIVAAVALGGIVMYMVRK